MAIEQTAVSYYGIHYAEHMRRDFDEMAAYGCSAVVLAVSEFDVDFWFPSIAAAVDEAHAAGLKVLLDPWGIGKYFGGEPVSLFLQNNVHNRQVTALGGEALPNACFNTRSFIDYFRGVCMKLARGTKADGFFWDEPHYAYPKAYASITGGAGDDWSCRCPVCQEKFKNYYGYEMPRALTDDVRRFRWREALHILEDASGALKAFNPQLEITVCVHATLNGYYVTEQRGYDDWDMVAACPHFDVFSTTILNWSLPDDFFEEIARRTVDVARRHGKKSERWLMGYYREPAEFGRIDRVVDLYERLGVDRISAWTYRGGHGTVLAAPHALDLWAAIGRNYRRVLKRKGEA